MTNGNVPYKRYYTILGEFEKTGGKIGEDAKTLAEKARWAGCKAALEDKPSSDNPYPSGGYLWLQWHEGFGIGMDS